MIGSRLSTLFFSSRCAHKTSRASSLAPGHSEEKHLLFPALQAQLTPETSEQRSLESLVGTQDQNLHFISDTGRQPSNLGVCKCSKKHADPLLQPLELLILGVWGGAQESALPSVTLR